MARIVAAVAILSLTLGFKAAEPVPAPDVEIDLEGNGFDFGHPVLPDEGGGDAVDTRGTPWDLRQRQAQQQTETVRELTVQTNTRTDDVARVRELEPARREFKSKLLDDLMERERRSREGKMTAPAERWDERAREWSNSAFDGRKTPDPMVLPPYEPKPDRIFSDDVKKRKEKGVRMFVDPAELSAVLAKSEERGLEMLQKMERDLVASKDPFSTLRAMKRRVTSALSTGALTAKLGYMKMPWSGVNESLVALSLRNLMARAGDKAELPEDVRTLGRLKRILGYMIDAENDDVVLIGTPGDKDDRATLLLDDLTLALKGVWIDGQKPGCSLDPDPNDTAGKQKVRVFGVPKDSNLARVMLDADYEMKKINMGLIKFDQNPIPGFKCNFDLQMERIKENPKDDVKASHARFWLTPMRPEPGDLQVEPGRGLVMFQTRVQLMTEVMAVSGDALVGTGKIDPVRDYAARIFTAHYEEIEKRRVVFRQLHALFDLVMFCQILRENAVTSELLAKIAARPGRKVAVPDAYDGCTRTENVDGTNIRFTVSGGVMVYLKLRRKYYRELEQKELRELETSIMDAMCGKSVSVADSSALKNLLKDRLRVEKEKREADLMFERGCGKFAEGKYDEAERFFTKAIDRDADFPEACCQRAMCRWQLKRYKEAIADCDLSIKKDTELWTSYWIRSKVKSEMGDRDGAAADWARYRELIEKDKLLKELVGKDDK